jgi:hypothetical protein
MSSFVIEFYCFTMLQILNVFSAPFSGCVAEMCELSDGN